MAILIALLCMFFLPEILLLLIVAIAFGLFD